MTVDRLVMLFASAMILLSLALSQLQHVYWQVLTAVIGANLVQASLSVLPAGEDSKSYR